MKIIFLLLHRYHRVLAALTQQSSELQDTRMLTEFLERVELEESQELGGGGGGGFSLAQVRTSSQKGRLYKSAKASNV